MAQIEITQQYVTYQSQTQLVTLAQQVATSRSKTKPAILDAIQVATQIRLGLEALNYSAFLTKSQIDEILYLLSDIASINALPYAPVVTSAAPPTILVGLPGTPGAQGPTGLTGGGTAFSVSGVNVDVVVDSFPITLSGSAEWTYEVYDSSNKRVERMVGTWLPDGSQFKDDGGITLDPEIGITQGKISFFVNIAGGIVQLVAHVTSGTWTINGSRVLIPVTGNGITLPTSLANGLIWIGNASNLPIPNLITGDISLSNTGVTAITAGVIVDADINGSAAIAVNKLAAMTALRAVVTDAAGFLTTSAATATQVGYLSNVTSDIQAQINAIAGAGAITGAITTFVTANASPSLVIVSNPAGKLVVGAATAIQVGYLSSLMASTDISNIVGTTSNVQAQINALIAAFVPAGSNTQIQYNSSGLFAANSNLTFSSATNTFTTGRGMFSNQNSAGAINLNPASAPLTPVSGDIFYDSGIPNFRATVSGTAYPLLLGASSTTQIPFATSTSGIMNFSSNFTFNNAGSTLYIGNATTTGSAFLKDQITHLDPTVSWGLGVSDNGGGNGGQIIMTAGNSTGGNGNGGDLILASGNKNGAGIAGNVYIYSTNTSGIIGLGSVYLGSNTIAGGPSMLTASSSTNAGMYLGMTKGSGATGQIVGSALLLFSNDIQLAPIAGSLLLRFTSLPTSSAGLPSGAVWRNSNVLTIVP